MTLRERLEDAGLEHNVFCPERDGSGGCDCRMSKVEAIITNAVAAERKRCSGILRAFIRYATESIGADRDYCIGLMRSALRGLDPSECKASLTREQEMADAVSNGVTVERERCAKIAESLVNSERHLNCEGMSAYELALRDVADAIRQAPPA